MRVDRAEQVPLVRLARSARCLASVSRLKPSPPAASWSLGASRGAAAVELGDSLPPSCRGVAVDRKAKLPVSGHWEVWRCAAGGKVRKMLMLLIKDLLVTVTCGTLLSKKS